jgi:Ribosome 60S biogenesis N-terminal
VEQQAAGKDGPLFLQALLHESPEFSDIWGVWHAQSKQGTTEVTVALLKALRAVLMVPVSHKDDKHTSACVLCELHALAKFILSTELPTCYRFLSSGNAKKASETLQLLTAGVAHSPCHCMTFLSNFNFSFPAIPKLAYRPGKKLNEQKEAAVAKRDNKPASASPHTYECYFNLALAVLRTCPSGAGLSKALHTPQLLPLALQQLTYVDTASCHLMCEALAARMTSPSAKCDQMHAYGLSSTCLYPYPTHVFAYTIFAPAPWLHVPVLMKNHIR